MAKIDRPTIVAGNDTTLYIQLKEFVDGEYVDDFDLTQVSDLKVELLCARDNYRYEIPYKIDPTYTNLIICDLKHTYYHTNTSYGIIVTGTNPDEKHWTWCMMPREGFLVVSNTSGLHLTDEAQQLSFNGLVGWGISTDADLTNYYTKIEINELLDQKVDESELTDDYYDSETIDELLEGKADTSDLDDKQDTLVSGQNIKTINNISLLGPGNIDIQAGSDQVQSDWTQTDTTDPSYIKHKPDLSQYATEQELNDYYDKGEVDGMLNNKVDTSTLNSDYYNKNTVNNLLDAKADTSDLSQVATSGSYNDLTNKPDLTQYATHSELNAKQDELVSGSNIKTINNQSILGSGNIDIQGGGGTYTAGKNINITNNVISTTDDIDAGTITAEDIKIKETESGTVHYVRWYDTVNRYLADQAMAGTEMRIGDQWYTYGNKGTLYIDTQNDGVITISYTEWEIDTNPPSWVPDWITNPHKSTTTVNGYPVYGAYNPDSDSPDFYIYDADNYGINSIWVNYVNIPTEKPLSYWHIKGTGMYVDTNNTTDATFAADRQISIGANNSFGSGANVVMVGDELMGEYTGNQLIVGKYNKEKNALFTVANGQSDSTFWAYSTSIDDDYTFTMWTALPEEFFNESGNVTIRVITMIPEWTELFACAPYLSFWHLNDSNPYSENMELEYQGTTYYARITMQRDANNLGVTFELYTDDQHTTPYNIFASPAEVDMATVWVPLPYRRDAFFVAESGDVYMPYYQDKNNTFNLGEEIYNLQNRPQAVQSDWNEGDSTSLAYIQNKPTITQPVQSDWNESDSSSLAYIQNKPNLSEPGFVKLVNGNKTGLVSSLATVYNSNIGNGAVIEGNGYGSEIIKAQGYLSHAEGYATEANSDYTHAEGYKSRASGTAAHAEGYGTLAQGSYSHTEGRDTWAAAYYSHAEGCSTTARNQSEHASGQYNVCNVNNNTFGDAGNTLFSIGNGTNAASRHNAFEIRQNGDIYLNDGSHPISSTNNGMKIEVVQALPATQDSNTIYIIA